MRGYFSSDPYQDEDWSGRGRVTFYMDIEPDVMIHPDYLPILTTEELNRTIPEFDWTGGHSGRLLEVSLAEKLEKIWATFVNGHSEMFIFRAARQKVDPNDFPSANDDQQIVEMHLTNNGMIRLYNLPCDVEIEGDNVDSAKNQFAAEINQKTGKKPDLIFKYEGIEKEYQLLYDKVIRIVLLNKKAGLSFYLPFWSTQMRIVSMLNKVSASPELLIKQGFPDEIVTSVKALERKPEEDFLHYVKRAANDEFAKEIIEEEINDALRIRDLEIIDDDRVKALNENLAALRYLESLNKR